MPPKTPWQHHTLQLNNKGLDVIHPVDQVGEDNFSRMEDVKSLQEGCITPRPGTSLLNLVAIDTPAPTPTLVFTDPQLFGSFDGVGGTVCSTSVGGVPSGTIPFVNNRLYLCAVFGESTGGVVSVTSVTGGGITWVKVNEVQFKSIASPTAVIANFRGLVTSGAFSDDLTFTYDTTVDDCICSITEVDGIDLGGTNGSAAVVQSATDRSDSASSLSVALAPFGNILNGAYGFFYDGSSGGTWNPGTGWTDLSARIGAAHCQVKDVNDTTVEATKNFAPGTVGAIGLEIKAA